MSTQRPVVNPQRKCSDCGKPVSDQRAKRCRACFDKRARPEPVATKVIRVHMETWKRIQAWAEPLEDTPDSVIRRILDAAESPTGDPPCDGAACGVMHEPGSACPPRSER